MPGFARVAALVGLPDALVGADLVLTGEGSFDAQSALGKGPVGVADLARARGVPVVVLAGRVEHPLGPVGDRVDAAFGIHPAPRTPAEAMDPDVTAAALRGDGRRGRPPGGPHALNERPARREWPRTANGAGPPRSSDGAEVSSGWSPPCGRRPGWCRPRREPLVPRPTCSDVPSCFRTVSVTPALATRTPASGVAARK